MYYYLFDQPLSEKKYQPVINRIEFRVNELGLTGRTDRLSILKNMRELIESAIRRGAKTVVIIGDDTAVAKAISIVAPYDVTLGLIPVGDQLNLSRILGIPSGPAACDVLSRRIVRTIDLGQVNDQYFLCSLDVPAEPVTVECDGHYRVSILGLPRPMSIRNFRPDADPAGASDPEDGVLEAVISEQRSSWPWQRSSRRSTVLPLRKARISSARDSIPLTLDGHIVVKTPVTVEVAPRKLRIIVGKDRRFL